MTINDIITAFCSGGTVPEAAITAGVARAGELAPVVFTIADKVCRGVYLLPADNNLLFYGLHVLAAARHADLPDQLIALARQPAEALDQLFPDHTSTALARLLLSVWDRDAEALFGLIEHADMAPEAKFALYDVLARLTFDGRIPRDTAAAFLARVERDNLIDDGDMVWFGWQQTVAKLGLADLEPALRRAWTKPIFAEHDETDHAHVLDTLRLAAADRADATVFDAEDLRPIVDAAEAVAWLARRARGMAAWDAQQAAVLDGDAPDPAATQRLTADEQAWLSGFLDSRQVPANTMPFEMLDGFLTALVIGPRAMALPELLPVAVLPVELLLVVWGHEDGRAPAWDSPEQEAYVSALLAKHCNAIAVRRAGKAEHRPFIEHFSEAMPAEQWAEGFVTGVDLRRDAWEPMFADRRADQVVLPILALSGDTPDDFKATFTEEKREMIIEQLPVTLQMIAAYWQTGPQVLPRQQPVRSAKVGRNEPCPCGSGKKFKTCCGANGSTLH